MEDVEKKPRRLQVKKKKVEEAKPVVETTPVAVLPPKEEAKADVPKEWPAPSKENTLYLTIKQCYFDEIVAGTKDKEYREIKETTYKRYLDCTPDGLPYWAGDEISEEDMEKGFIWVWNNGVYPYFAKESIWYLNLAVGYAKERDTMLVEVLDFSFEPLTHEDTGKPLRFFDPEMKGEAIFDDDGDLCFWMIVFHLGNIVELNRKRR